MSYNNHCKKNKHRRSSHPIDFKVLGLILLSFGAITICAFLLPAKAWILLLGLVLLLCGVLLMFG